MTQRMRYIRTAALDAGVSVETYLAERLRKGELADLFVRTVEEGGAPKAASGRHFKNGVEGSGVCPRVWAQSIG